MTQRNAVATLCLAACIAGSALAQEESVISVDVSRVVLYVTVRDSKMGYVGNLTQQDFTVKENGRPQEIRQFSRGEVPVAVGLVIDNSQSMFNKRKEVIAAAKAFIRASNPQDEMFVVHFNEDIVFGLPEGKDFSSDQAELDKALERLTAEGQTALYDAIYKALNHLAKSNLTKKALFVISDGGDNRSKKKLQDVLKAADLSGALFYAIGIYDPMDGEANPEVLRKLAHGTGGEAFFPQSLAVISELCETIARDLRNQYMLVYAPASNPNDASYHKVEVSVPSRRHLTVRTRTGYYGPAAASLESKK
jgi:VWFA-related protein